MADTAPLTPTDAELWQLYMQRPGQHKDPIDFARAVLARWGTPAPVGVEPVAWAATSEDGDVEALGMNQSRRFDTPLYTTPQPTHAQAGAVNIVAAAKKLAECLNYQWDYMSYPSQEEMRKHAQAVIESALGIKGGQHGVDRL